MVVRIDGKGKCQIDDKECPEVGFGTYPLQNDICFQAVTQAVDLGYRIIDTATFYNNFVPIGKAIKGLGRDKFYLISKVWPDEQTTIGIKNDIEKTLNQLQTDYLDAYLLHWPNSKIPLRETLSAMERLRAEGRVRHIGMCNVTVNHLKRVLALNIPITWVQVEINPYFCDLALLEFCQENQIALQAWAPLARGRVNEHAVITKLESKYQKTSAQIALKWIIQHHCLPLPGSKNLTHMKQNLNLDDFILTKEDMVTIDNIAMQGKRERISLADGLGFGDEFDFSYEECWPK